MSSVGKDDRPTKLCIACSKWVDPDKTSCTCGHVFKQVKSINGKRFTEGRFYQEAEDNILEPKRKARGATSMFYREKITYMPGFTYEEIEDVSEKRERKRRRRKPIDLLSSTANNKKTLKDISVQDVASTVDGIYRKESSHKPIQQPLIEQPLIQVLQEINNKITNQRRLWIDLDS